MTADHDPARFGGQRKPPKNMERFLGTDAISTVRSKSGPESPTMEAYGDTDHAFDFFNERLFGGALPNCLITLTRRSNCLGYFRRKAFASVFGTITDEISLNPAHFVESGDAGVLSTLVHEQVHLWREVVATADGKVKPSSRGYHDRIWADKMEQVGLRPTDTGGPDGKRTGYRVTHLIVPGGQFDLDCRELLAGGFRVNWHDCEQDPIAPAGPRKAGKATPFRGSDRKRFTCPDCELKAWAKPTAKLACAECGLLMFRSD